MNDARSTADCAVLGISLVLAATEVDVELLCFTAEWAHDLGAGLFLLQSERKNVTRSACSSAERSEALPCSVPPQGPKRSATLLAQPSWKIGERKPTASSDGVTNFPP